MRESEAPERPRSPVDDRLIAVADPQDAAAVAPLRVEDAREEALAPFVSRATRPLDELADSLDTGARLRPDGHRGLVVMSRGEVLELVGLHICAFEIVTSPSKRLEVGKREPEAMMVVDCAARTFV